MKKTRIVLTVLSCVFVVGVISFFLINVLSLQNNLEPIGQTQEKEKVLQPELYKDIHLYQGVFYFGRNDALLELRKENEESFFIIHSVRDNNITVESETPITDFSTEQKSDRNRDVYCVINGNNYRLMFFSPSIKYFVSEISRISKIRSIHGYDIVPLQAYLYFPGEYRAVTLKTEKILLKYDGNGIIEDEPITSEYDSPDIINYTMRVFPSLEFNFHREVSGTSKPYSPKHMDCELFDRMGISRTDKGYRVSGGYGTAETALNVHIEVSDDDITIKHCYQREYEQNYYLTLERIF